MILDNIEIGTRIRKIREEKYKETRQLFAERCGLSENHLGKLERGALQISINALNKICSATGTTTDYILYGESETKNLKIRKSIDNFLDRCTKKQLKLVFQFISTLESYYEDD